MPVRSRPPLGRVRPTATSARPTRRPRAHARRRSAPSRSTSCSTRPCRRRSARDDALGRSRPRAPRPRCSPRSATLAARNTGRTSLIGMGYTGTITPPVIQRNVLENPAWYTAYTPYQAEISQGRLEALLNFQTMVERTDRAAGRQRLAARRGDRGRRGDGDGAAAREGRRRTASSCTPTPTRRRSPCWRTRAEPIGIELVVGDVGGDDVDDGCFGALFSLPTSTGAVADWSAAIDRVHARRRARRRGHRPPRLRADDPSRRSSAPTSPSVRRSASACRWASAARTPRSSPRSERAARALPGRLVGVSTDTAGRPALRLALQTREQHIRREKATSNICTAQVLLANIAGLYAAWHGPTGCAASPNASHRLTSIAAAGLRAAGHHGCATTRGSTRSPSTASTPTRSLAAARAAGLDLRRVDDGTVGLTFDETSTLDAVDRRWPALGAALAHADGRRVRRRAARRRAARPTSSSRRRVFHRYHTEHEMLRYLRRLADHDLALDRTMIPLGSCTMKLNATAEMVPITWPEFADAAPVRPGRRLGRATAR